VPIKSLILGEGEINDGPANATIVTSLRNVEFVVIGLLAATHGGGDATTWLEWFLEMYVEACRTSTVSIDEALQRGRFWATHRAVQFNEMQRRVLDRMLEAGPGRFEGGLTARKYLAIASTTKVGLATTGEAIARDIEAAVAT